MILNHIGKIHGIKIPETSTAIPFRLRKMLHETTTRLTRRYDKRIAFITHTRVEAPVAGHGDVKTWIKIDNDDSMNRILGVIEGRGHRRTRVQRRCFSNPGAR